MTLCSEKFGPTFYFRFRLIQPRFSASGQRSRRSGQRDNEMANDFDSYGLLTPHKSCPHTFYFRFSVEISDYFLSRWVSEIGTRKRPDSDLATDFDSIRLMVANSVSLYLHLQLDYALIIASRQRNRHLSASWHCVCDGFRLKWTLRSRLMSSRHSASGFSLIPL